MQSIRQPSQVASALFECRYSHDPVLYRKGKVTSGAMLIRVSRSIGFERN
jgi:hypothetical protein